MLDQQSAIQELAATNRELESILAGLAVYTNPQPPIAAANDGSEGPSALAVPEKLEIPSGQLPPDLQELLRNGREILRESVLIRRRSRAILSTIESLPRPPAKPLKDRNALSKREQSVLTLIVEGKSSKEIAAQLGISFKTAVTHRASIMGKLEVHEIASLVREAIRLGLA